MKRRNGLGIDPFNFACVNFADPDHDRGGPWSINGPPILECLRVGAERFGLFAEAGSGASTGRGRWRIVWA